MKKVIFTLCLSLLALGGFAQEIALSNSQSDADYFSILNNENTIKLPNKDLKLYETTKATCFCVVSYNNLTNQPSRSGVCLDLTSELAMSFGGVNQQSTQNQRRCDQKCSDVAAGLSQSQLQAIANCACSAQKANNTIIRAYSALGTKRYSSAHHIGYLERSGAIYETVCTCPDGWVVDDGQSDINRKCKKELCKVESPIANVQLPNMPGFVWDNVIYQWIRGNCSNVEVSPAVCRIRR